MPGSADVLIAGGGIIGSSLAWALASRGITGIVVVDLDLAGVYASSELNAGGARATWWQRVNIETCRATLDFFREHAGDFGFDERGYLWLYDDADLHRRALEKRALQNEFGLDVEALSPEAVRERFPVIDRHCEELVGATYSPRDGLVNPNAVRRWYRAEAEALGVVFLNRHYISGLSTGLRSGPSGSLRRVTGVDVVEVARRSLAEDERDLREILVHHRVDAALHVSESHVACERVVNCLGAWSPIFSAKVGVSDMSEPVRRQISLVDVHAHDVRAGVELPKLGMIVDPSGLYLHGEGAYVLAGYSTPAEPSGFDFEYDGRAFFERELWPRLAHRASSFERCHHVRGWAGLYAVTPDRSGIAGTVAGFADLYEAHAFTGRGVMQSYAIGQAMADLIAAGRFERFDLSPLSRERFADPERWVREELHI